MQDDSRNRAPPTRVAVSLQATVVDREGVEQVLRIELSEDEVRKLRHSAEVLRGSQRYDRQTEFGLMLWIAHSHFETRLPCPSRLLDKESK